MKLLRFISVALVAVFTAVTFNMNVANAAGTYKISCKNDVYGMHQGADYTTVMYIYNSSTGADAVGVVSGSTGNSNTLDQYINDAAAGEAYVGNDCIYSGSADTNGTAVVAGDVARIAVNAIIGAVSNRIDMAYAASNSGASATGLSFTTQADGGAMSANSLVAGISFWADYGNSNFENTQAYTNNRLDSMAYDGDASSYTLGVDKAFGKALVGVIVSGFDTELKTTFNKGTYKQEIDTYGVYVAYRTSVLHIDLGTGTGDSTIDTTRIDLGNDQTITGSTTADISYSNARVAAHFSRGRFSIVPSASYRSMEMDMKAFTDVRPDDVAANIAGGTSQLLFTTGAAEVATGGAGLQTTDDQIAARSVKTETMSLGLKVSADLGSLIPYISMSYDSEDTTRAVYKAEVTDDTATETVGTNYSSSLRIGGGVNFMLGSHLRGGVRAGTINGRDDWDENYVAGSISLGF